MSKRPVSFNTALGILQHRPDARLVQANGRRGAEFYLQPDGRRVRPADARKVIQHLSVADAGLFSGTPQSWRGRCRE
jgi:hypothetical protein